MAVPGGPEFPVEAGRQRGQGRLRGVSMPLGRLLPGGPLAGAQPPGVCSPGARPAPGQSSGHTVAGTGGRFSSATAFYWLFFFFSVSQPPQGGPLIPWASGPHDTGINPGRRGVLCVPQCADPVVTPQVRRRAGSPSISAPDD